MTMTITTPEMTTTTMMTDATRSALEIAIRLLSQFRSPFLPLLLTRIAIRFLHLQPIATRCRPATAMETIRLLRTFTRPATLIAMVSKATIMALTLGTVRALLTEMVHFASQLLPTRRRLEPTAAVLAASMSLSHHHLPQSQCLDLAERQ